MIRILILLLALSVLSCEARERGVESREAFTIKIEGANSLLHKPGVKSLYRKNAAGKNELVWSHVFGYTDVVGDVAVFGARTNGYPAVSLMACTTTDLPVKINRMITKIACAKRGMIFTSDTRSIEFLVGLNRQDASTKNAEEFQFDPVSFDPEIYIVTPNEVKKWVLEAQGKAPRFSIENNEYIDPN